MIDPTLIAVHLPGRSGFRVKAVNIVVSPHGGLVDVGALCRSRKRHLGRLSSCLILVPALAALAAKFFNGCADAGRVGARNGSVAVQRWARATRPQSHS